MHTDEDRLLKLDDVKRLTGLGRSSIYAYGARGLLPRPYRVGPGSSRWSEREIQDWIAERKRRDGDRPEVA